MIHVLSESNSIFNQFLAEIRDEVIQKDPLRFRRNLERVGEIFAYEISKKLTYKTKDITTPLGVAKIPVPGHQPVLATILRAGLPLHQGFLANTLKKRILLFYPSLGRLCVLRKRAKQARIDH